MRPQSVRYALTTTAAVVLVAVLAVMVNWIGARRWGQFDWTRSEIFSLSEKTEAILAGLDEEIRVVVFMVPDSPLYDQVREILDRYSAVSDKIAVQIIDPHREPLQTRQLAERFGISVADTVVFSRGDRVKYVTSDEMVEFDYAGMGYGGTPQIKSFKGEEQFTSAILSLVAPGVPRVAFVTGHGEASTAGGGALVERNLGVLVEALTRENMDTEDLNLLAGQIPENVDALAIVGPTEPYTAAELELLSSYLAGGGRLLLCLDPLIDPSGVMKQTRLEGFLAAHGVEVGDDLVVDPARRLPFFDLSAVYLTDFSSHPVTTGLEGVAALFPVARSLTPTENAQWTVTTLVETSAEGWGETNFEQLLKGEPVAVDEGDRSGPIAVAMVVEAAVEEAVLDDLGLDEDLDPEPLPPPQEVVGGRMVVFGDSDFLVDSELGNAGNQTLALNAFNWLVAQESSLGIPPRDVEQVSLYLAAEQLNFIYFVTMLLLPGLTILAGILVWRRRRH